MDAAAVPPLGDAQPLRGLRVIELASVLAGPLAGTFFSELGAEVIKIEHPGTGGDVTRSWRAAGEGGEGPSAYYAAANGPKEVRMLDLSSEEDRGQLEELLSSADILLQNFKASSLPRLGLDPRFLGERHPTLIHVHLKGFLNEPDRPGYDMVVQAETGFMALNGEPGRAPFRMPVALMDVLAAHQMRSAALLALWERERDGKGSYLEVWLDASGMGGLVNRATEFLVAGREPHPLGQEHPQIAPYGEHFSCACGGAVVLAIGNDRQFAALCDILGHPEWSADSRFSTNPERVHHRKELAGLLSDAFAGRQRDEVMDAGLEAGIPMGRLQPVSAAMNGLTGQAMTHAFQLEGREVRNIRQVAFRIQRNGNFST